MELKELRETRNGMTNGVPNQDSIQNLVEAEEISNDIEESGSVNADGNAEGHGRVDADGRVKATGSINADGNGEGRSQQDDVEEGRGDGKSDDALLRRHYRAYDLPFCTNFMVKWRKITKYIPISPTYEG